MLIIAMLFIKEMLGAQSHRCIQLLVWLIDSYFFGKEYVEDM